MLVRLVFVLSLWLATPSFSCGDKSKRLVSRRLRRKIIDFPIEDRELIVGDGSRDGSGFEDESNNDSSDESEEDFTDVPSLKYGVTGMLSQCQTTWFDMQKEFGSKQQEAVDKTFKDCLKKEYHDVEGDVHFDIVQSTYQKVITVDRRQLTGDYSGTRRLVSGRNGNMNVWWGCSDCLEDNPTSDAYRRRGLSLVDLGTTQATALSSITTNQFDKSVECLSTWAKKHKTFKDCSGVSVSCDNFDTVYVGF
mmetsp:Transcript_16690/g.25547  ORF Transcript_16690/g.25547 Transcript_16690/m.25547 type:complete len:250 (-) Transcript_16690:54-803(-)